MLLFIAIASAFAAVALGFAAWQVISDDRKRSEARVAALAVAIDGPEGSSVPAGHRSLFATGGRSPMQGRPLLKVAIGFVMAVTVIVLIAMTGDREDAPAPVAAAAAEPASLELVSMRH